ncbi:amidohydrolase family protein [candidate division KSB1 bacterium]
MVYDLLVKGGEVIDPARGIRNILDIGVVQGHIAAVASEIPVSEARKVINAGGMLVTPGLIDIHTHVAEAIMPIAVTPDEAGVLTGVTAVCDAGSTGYATFNGFKKLIIPHARTDIFCFLHMSPSGQSVYPEIGWGDIDAGRMLKLIEENRRTIKGIKLRATTDVVEGAGLKLVKKAKEIGREAGLPIAVHIGIDRGDVVADEIIDQFTRKMLILLEEGDIVVHFYTHRQGGVIRQDGQIMNEFIDAAARGVVLDVAPAQSHFSFELAKIGLEQGLEPTTISTDITVTNYQGPVLFSLPAVMSKFLALGLSLEQVIEKTTINPAKVLGEEERKGSLKEGMKADISLLQLEEGEYVFSDGTAGNILHGTQLLSPRLTLKDGEEIKTQPRFKNYESGELLNLTKGT